jgi:curved DNA-binding protein CbpA
MVKDYYGILGVPRGASPDQIRSRFRDLARERHPDRFHGADKATAETEFQNLTEAFNVLSDAERRRRHDTELVRPEAGTRQNDAAQLTRVYMQRGVKAYKEQNFLEAADNFDRATKNDPNSAQAWHHLALACSRESRWQSRALAAIVQACELDNMNAAYLKLAGRIHQTAGMAARAEEYYNQALTWGGEDPAVRQALLELGEAARLAKKGRSGIFGKAGG